MKTISIIAPCYNEQEVLSLFFEELMKTLSEVTKLYELNYEILFIDDGSSDATLDCIKELEKKDSHVKYISFSRNFGKESAMFAGFEQATGDYVAIMDVDLQDPPELLLSMFRAIVEEGYDNVAVRRVNRKGEPPIRSFFAKMFYKLINKISHTEIKDGARDYRLMTRQYVNSIIELKEYNRFSKGIFGWVGYRTKYLEYQNVQRAAGESKWSFWKLFVYSIDGIVAFSTFPLILSSIIGLILCIISFALIIFVIGKTLFYGDPVAGYPSLLCMIMFLGGIQLFAIGILGQYLSKIYLEVKQRQIYIISETNLK